MANKLFNRKENMPNASYPSQQASASMPGTPMKTGPFKGNIGKTGPNRDTMGVRKVKQHTQDVGL